MPSAEGATGSGGQSGQTQMPSAVEGVNGIAHHFEYPEKTPEGPYRVLDQYVCLLDGNRIWGASPRCCVDLRYRSANKLTCR
jgi:hypothetical protein